MQSEDLINQVLEEIESFNIDDIPNIDLYMDQVTTFMETKLSGYKRNDQDKILTKTMINNYATPKAACCLLLKKRSIQKIT